MNKKGFTLIELLAVIIILSLLALIVSTSITKVVTNSKNELYNTQLTLIKQTAETWGADNLDKLPSENNECKYLYLGELKKYGLLDSDIINPRTNKEFSDTMNIKISYTLTDYGNLNFKYEVDSDISNCTPVYEKICTLVSDADGSNSVTSGDKYQCKVKDEMETEFEDGYYFYILSNNNDGTVNLIMDRNINSDGTPVTKAIPAWEKAQNNNIYNLVAWIKEDDYKALSDFDDTAVDGNNFGPITSLNFLYDATKHWLNIPELNYIYNDREYQGMTGDVGYTSFISKDGIATLTARTGLETVIGTNEEPLRARMPIYTYKNSIEKGDVSNKKEDNSNAYLYDYLSLYNGIQANEISDIDGYWTLSSSEYTPRYARLVQYTGVIDVNNVAAVMLAGVRPVITIPKYNLSN